MDPFQSRDAIRVLELAAENIEKGFVSKGARSCILKHVAIAGDEATDDVSADWQKAGKKYFGPNWRSLYFTNDFSFKSDAARKVWALRTLRERIQELKASPS